MITGNNDSARKALVVYWTLKRIRIYVRSQARHGRVPAYALTLFCVLQWTRHVTDVCQRTLSRSSVCDSGPGTSKTCSSVRSHALPCVTVDQACHRRVPAYVLTLFCVWQWTRHVMDVFHRTFSHSSVCDSGPGLSQTCSSVRSHALRCVTVDQACHRRGPAYVLTLFYVWQWTRHVTDVFQRTFSRSSVCDSGPGTSRTWSSVRSHALPCVTVDQARHGRVPA